MCHQNDGAEDRNKPRNNLKHGKLLYAHTHPGTLTQARAFLCDLRHIPRNSFVVWL